MGIGQRSPINRQLLKGRLNNSSMYIGPRYYGKYYFLSLKKNWEKNWGEKMGEKLEKKLGEKIGMSFNF
jgi:hypothetical protein